MLAPVPSPPERNQPTPTSPGDRRGRQFTNSWRSWAARSGVRRDPGVTALTTGPGGHDDIANAAAGALGLALARPVAQLRSEDFILGAPLQSANMLPPCPDWRTAFPEYDYADW